MPDSRSAHVPWWPFILAIVLCIVIAVLGVMFYGSYAHNMSLAHENDQLSASILTLNEDNARLSKRVGELECVGVWTGVECTKAPTTLTASPATGTSPLAVQFTVRASSAEYTLDFGDNATTSRPRTAEACKQESDGLCTFTLKHTYKLPAGATTTTTFSAKIMKDGAVEASTDIQVSKK